MLAAWRKEEEDIYHTSSGIAKVMYLQIKAQQILCENESQIYDERKRIPLHILMHSC